MADDTCAPYNFDKRFETLVVAWASSSSKFWGLIATSIEIDAFALPAARDALKAVRDIAKERGMGPDNEVLVLQRMRRWMDDGQIGLDRIHAVADLFDDADDMGRSTMEAVLNELVPVLKARAMQRVTIEVIEESAKPRPDLPALAHRITGIDRLGQRDSSLGFKIGRGSLDRIVGLHKIDRMPTGIQELDTVLDGGMGHGLGIFVAGTGVGKSMYLCHVAAHALMSTQHVLYATLELSAEEIEARIVANLTGLPINALMGGVSHPLADQRLAALEPFFGACFVQYFTPKMTTVDDIVEWVGEHEREHGVPVSLVILDMLAKLKGYRPIAGQSRNASTYQEQGDVAEQFRNYLIGTKKHGWTGDQPQRGAKDRKRIDTDDVSDSMEKSRICDLMVTAVRSEDGAQMEYFVAKNRHAEARKIVGPLPHDHACGRMVPVLRRIGGAVW